MAKTAKDFTRRRGTVRLDGAQELLGKFAALASVVLDTAPEAALAGAEVIRQAASDNARAGRKYATGDLADHIVKELDERALERERVLVKIGPDREHFYGLFVELGHAQVRVTGRYRKGGRIYRQTEQMGQVPPYPFLRPALDEKKAEATQEVGRVLWQAIERAATRR